MPELSPAERRVEALALGLCVSMKVQIFFSTQVLLNLQQSSLLQQLQQEKTFTGHFKLFCLTLCLYFDHTKLVKGRQNNHFKQ